MSNQMRTHEANSGRPYGADGELDFGTIRRALWRKKWWILLPTLLAAGLSYFVVNTLTPRYKAEARILIEGRENVFLRPEAEKAGDRERTIIDPEAVTSQVQLVLSREVARQVIPQLKLAERPEFDPVLRGVSTLRHVLTVIGLAKDPLAMTPEERVSESYFERLTAFSIDRSRVIVIEFQSSDPELAARAVNAVADAYIGLQQSVRQDQTRAAGRWLAGEIETLRNKVADAEGKAEAFRSKSNLFIGTNNNSLSNQQLSEINTQLITARSQKAEADAKARAIREMLRSGAPIESSEVVNSELIRRLNEQRVTLRAQLAEQSSTLLNGHPRIKELRAQIADLERQIRAEAERVVRSLENDAKIAGVRVDQLASALDLVKNQASSTNEQDVQLRSLEREAKAQRDLLESYLAKYREAAARENLADAPAEARIISRGIVSNTPFFPKKLPIMLVATLGTLLLGVAFVTTGELLSGNIYRSAPMPGHGSLVNVMPAESPSRFGRRWTDDLERRGTLLAPEAPIMPSASGLQAPGAPGPAPLGAIVAHLGRGPSRTAVVGCTPQANGSHAALALARALTEQGRVVLVDLALNSRALSKELTEATAPGVGELLRGGASFGKIIARDQASRLHVIPVGDIGLEDSSAFGSERLIIAMDALARTYEHVIIDAGLASELPAEKLARFASTAVVVTSADAPEGAAAVSDQLLAAGISSVLMLSGESTAAAPQSADANAAAA